MVGRLLIYPTYFIRFTFYTKPKEGRLKLGGLRATCCPLATPARKRAGAHMAPLDGAEKAAVLDLFAGRRGTRTLIESSREKFAAYFVAKGTTVKELPNFYRVLTTVPVTRTRTIYKGASIF